jgi:hypothetical protein
MMLPLILAMTMQASPAPQVQVLAREMMSQVEDPKQVVARTAAEFATLWKQHAGAAPMPKVDFGSRMVVAVFLGTRTSAGYSAEIVRTRLSGGTLIVEWQEHAPGRDEVSAQVMTSPAIVVSIPQFAGEVTFEKVEK